MGYNSNAYQPKYYSSFHHSITSICKSILPFPFNTHRLASADRRLAKQHSDNLKWQQNCYHQILNLMGLEKQGIVPPSRVSDFRTHLLETLLASKGAPHPEPPPLLRDKLLFLQELLYANCISADEYHASKRPLLQRLATQGAEIAATDVIVCTHKGGECSEEIWSEIDLRDDHFSHDKENCRPRNLPKVGSSAIKHIKDVVLVSQKHGRNKHRSVFDLPPVNNSCSVVNSGANYNKNGGASICKDGSCGLTANCSQNILTNTSENETGSILMLEEEGIASHSDSIDQKCCASEKEKDKEAVRGWFGKEKGHRLEKTDSKSARNLWEVGLDRLKRWKKSNNEDDETCPKARETVSSSEGPQLVESPLGRGPNMKEMKRKLVSDGASHGFFIDKVVGENIKKELFRIQTQLSTTNPNLKFSNDEMDAVCTKLPVDKGDLEEPFPKSWCDRHGDVVLNVVKNELKKHVGEMADRRSAVLERRYTNSKRWTC